MLARIAMALGGRIAEELEFGQVTTGAASDIQRATQYARYMICQEGMSDKLGLVSYGQSEDQPFLGRDLGMGNQRDYSEQTAIEIDDEVRRIVREQYERARAPHREPRRARSPRRGAPRARDPRQRGDQRVHRGPPAPRPREDA